MRETQAATRVAWGLAWCFLFPSTTFSEETQNLDARQEDLSGVYSCEGKNYDGGAYAGTVVIHRNGEGYMLLWSIGSQIHQGVALREGDLLSSSWTTAGMPGGIVVYKIQSDRKLVGRYTDFGGQIGTETLTFLSREPHASSESGTEQTRL